jgi:hypothetical protein
VLRSQRASIVFLDIEFVEAEIKLSAAGLVIQPISFDVELMRGCLILKIRKVRIE